MIIATITDKRIHIQPPRSTTSSRRHMLADGYDIVMDLREVEGIMGLRRAQADATCSTSSRTSRPARSATTTRRMDNPEFRERLADAALNKPANSDIYTTTWPSSSRPSRASPCPRRSDKHLFFVEGGALAVENALKAAFDWKVRKNFAKGYKEEQGHADHASPRGVPRPHRLHAVADEHGRPAQDAVLPEVRLAAHRQPEAPLPGDRGVARGRRERRENEALEQAKTVPRASGRTTSPRSSSSRSRARAATTTSAPSSSARCASSATRTRCSSSSTRCRRVSA